MIGSSTNSMFGFLAKAFRPSQSETTGIVSTETGQQTDSSNTQRDEYISSASSAGSRNTVSFKPTSFMTGLGKTQKASTPMENLGKDLNRILLEGMITRVLETNGVELKPGDVLAMRLNGKGEFSIDADNSKLGGASGDAIGSVCFMLTHELNDTASEDGTSLGDALLAQFAADLGFDLDEARNDDTFSISFTFKYDPKLKRNVIGDAVIQHMKNETTEMKKPRDPEDEYDTPEFSDDFDPETSTD